MTSAQRPDSNAHPSPAVHTPAENEKKRRFELAEFLRERRGRLQPGQLGLPERRRSRTPGLRREDVAERAGVSTAWYTYLEQGRFGARPSRELIASLAEALILTDADRAYLFTLTGHVAPTARSAGPDSSSLQALVDYVSAPAYCTDASTSVLAWNPLAREIFGDYAKWPQERRNLLWLLFNEPAFANRLTDRAEYAARVVHTFRTRSQAYLDDDTVICMVDELKARSSDFQTLWEARDLRGWNAAIIHVAHPLGQLALTTMMFQDLAPVGIRFTAYLPADDATARILQMLP